MFDDGVNVIVGQNGVGKTNLLEAMYVLMHGLSFRVADKELARHDSPWFRLDGTFDDQRRTIRYQTAVSPAKQVSINDGASRRFTRQLRLPVVLFEPDMLRVLSGSPARRRQLLDALIAQWFDDGASLLRRYERVLLQRNNILKNAYGMSPTV
ncbi:MAG: AAA family ATPase, partial [Candidatus Binatia bacterium]